MEVDVARIEYVRVFDTGGGNCHQTFRFPTPEMYIIKKKTKKNKGCNNNDLKIERGKKKGL